jgi:31-O-methyltransferase
MNSSNDSRDSAPQEIRLQDGRPVMTVSPAEAQLLWSELTMGGAYSEGIAQLRPGDLVLDIGANVGLAAIAFSQAAPVRIVAVEPAPQLYACLKQNLERYCPEAEAILAAVADRRGRAEFTYYPNAPGNSSLYADTALDDATTRTFLRNRGLDDDSIHDIIDVGELHRPVVLSVDTLTIDDLLSQREGDVGLLKVDVERAEFDVLAGAQRSWSRIRHVVVEVQDVNGALSAVATLLSERGFNVSVAELAQLRGTGMFELSGSR